MPVKFYQNRIQKKTSSPIDILNNLNKIYVHQGGGDANPNMSHLFAPNALGWEIKNIAISFDSANEKTIRLFKYKGRGIFEGLNDCFWLKAANTPNQKITIPKGFYSDNFPDIVRNALDQNETFQNANVAPFSVSFDPTTRLFSIGASEDVKFYIKNDSSPGRHADSTAGESLGFSDNTNMQNPIVSDTPLFDFDVKFKIFEQINTASQDFYISDTFKMGCDDALVIETETSHAMACSYSVAYQIIN